VTDWGLGLHRVLNVDPALVEHDPFEQPVWNRYQLWRTQETEPGRTRQIMWLLQVPDDYVIDLMGQQSYQSCINRLATPGASDVQCRLASMWRCRPRGLCRERALPSGHTRSLRGRRRLPLQRVPGHGA